MNKRHGLLMRFAIALIVFAVAIISITAVVTYYAQMNSYRKLCWERIENVGDYLENLIQEDGEDFIEYTAFYEEHYEDIRIPVDFDNYQADRERFNAEFTREYPGKTFMQDIRPSEMPYDLQLLYYTYKHEYWLLTFEKARESFNLPYTYFLTMKEDIYDVVYQIDGERTEDAEHPGYLYMGDEYYNDPDTHKLIWTTWETGEKQDDVFEWDNQWGNTYSYYTPLVINGQKLGLIVAEVDVANVNRGILNSTRDLCLRIGGVFFIGILLLLFILNGAYISKIDYLADQIRRFTDERDVEVVDELRKFHFGEDEIGILANTTADMIQDLKEHEAEVERAAKMKTDFLANMNHEIRTPMNGVIGMAEMALREEVSDTARNYIAQIKSSGRVLLTIINDILDFSKIESGTLEILPIDYEPMSMFNDVANIVMTRLVNKNVELDLDIDPRLPIRLNGDNIRIRQILLNLAGNSAKFTSNGYIRIKAECDRINDTQIRLSVSVEDTGLGIRKDDLERIFESFSQVDSKRNRSTEGTGLGLAISQRLINLMDGTLTAESEYGKGSTFAFSLVQNIVDETPAMLVKNPDDCVAFGLFADEMLRKTFERDSGRLGVETHIITATQDLDAMIDDIRNSKPKATPFVFFDEKRHSENREEFFKDNPDVCGILVSEFGSRSNPGVKNILVVKKPLSGMNIAMLYNREKIYFDPGLASVDDSDFVAPEANILIVDDNAVNLTIAEGLLSPLKVKTMTATGGQEAIDLLTDNKFDIILMDHMMPVMDGVEATHIIREKYPEYKDIPIIALTANAVSEAREMFKQEGLDDFIPKPIEVKTLISKMKKWIPAEKIRALTVEEQAEREENSKSSAASIEIGDLDTAAAIERIGSEELFWNILKEYYRVMKPKTNAIKLAMVNEDWPSYTIEVHALKSTSRQIGAGDLAQMAADLEDAGKNLNVSFIEAHTEALLEKYHSYEPILAPFFTEDESNDEGKTPIEASELIEIFSQIKEAADNLNLDEMEAGMNRIREYKYPDDQKELLKRLQEAIDNIDSDSCVSIMEEWDKLL